MKQKLGGRFTDFVLAVSSDAPVRHGSPRRGGDGGGTLDGMLVGEVEPTLPGGSQRTAPTVTNPELPIVCIPFC